VELNEGAAAQIGFFNGGISPHTADDLFLGPITPKVGRRWSIRTFVVAVQAISSSGGPPNNATVDEATVILTGRTIRTVDTPFANPGAKAAFDATMGEQLWAPDMTQLITLRSGDYFTVQLHLTTSLAASARIGIQARLFVAGENNPVGVQT
jgi:hypothetical protein